MSEKRRLSTRNRGEPPLKKRALTPPPPPPPAPQVRQAEPTEPGLPVRLRDGQPLPTLSEPQDRNLSDKAYQSISESGVLSAAIDRSRQKWQIDGIFERYWSKPSKKKGLTEAPNPAKETMTKLGVCSMIIEPHVFEITLYTVKDLPAPYMPPTMYPPPPLSTPQYNAFSYNALPPPTQYPVWQGQQKASSSQTSLPPFREGFGQLGSQAIPSIYHSPQATPKPPLTSQPPALPRSGSNGRNTSQNRDEETKADPVIQMLATRAAANPDLKALMKVVALGNATPVQLRKFQDHIDDLNAILKSRPNPLEPLYEDSYPDLSPHTQQPVSRPAEASFDQSTTSAIQVHPSPAPPPIKIEPTSQRSLITAPPGTNPKAHSAGKPDMTAIVFDFGGNGDRFSFPRYSVLEYRYSGTQVIVSFLVIRRGSMAASAKHKSSQSYYQPITMQLTTVNAKILEQLGRIVAPQNEVRSYMESVFKTMIPADTVYLATRLPRTADAVEIEKKEKIPPADVQLIRPNYSPPSSVVPLNTLRLMWA